VQWEENRLLLLVFSLLSFIPGTLQAQSLSLGVKGGIPFTDAVEGSFGNRSEARRYTVGPMVEIGLPLSLAVEFNALYKRTGYSTIDSSFGITSIGQVRKLVGVPAAAQILSARTAAACAALY
jgi:hypothetical protein